jgi:hypothetical protein
VKNRADFREKPCRRKAVPTSNRAFHGADFREKNRADFSEKPCRRP